MTGTSALVASPADVHTVSELLAQYRRCGPLTLELQLRKACSCGANPPCHNQLKDVAERLEAVDIECHARLCKVGSVHNSMALDDAVRQVLGYSVRTSAAVFVPGSANKRSPIYGLGAWVGPSKRTRDGTAPPPIEAAVSLLEVRSIRLCIRLVPTVRRRLSLCR